MIDPITARTWGHRLLFVALILLVAFFQLLPLGGAAGGLPGPDLAIALTFAWVLRRPAYVPVPLIAVLFLFLDLLLQRPPGLGAALMVVAAEFLRSRRDLSRALPFPIEWATVTAVILAVAGANQIALVLVAADPPPLGSALLRSLFTALAYPFAVLLSHYAFGVRAARPNEADALGKRL
ncbi:rod shape-determining protein MreD [Tropicimonas sp. IMCC6043]|uniref:rod shape-determining protein MreD n=1 Tax=Tropicimonas sp. IMCC6043 TaxID=2510645 RepID=UPI00101DC5B8|nr:rod shape-determining protein MreD [Tropicimonas sp. IMCC6043]RYH08897.1 rod shape-determining protein MreD [Tropicimonas sp. IMCC6043]